RLALLNDLGRRMSLAISTDEIFNVAIQFTPQIIPADHVSVAMLTETSDTLEVWALQGVTSTMPVGERLPITGTLAGRAVTEKRVVRTDDARKTDTFEALK